MADIELGLNPTSLRWQAPTENVDGTPVNGPLNYNLYRRDPSVQDDAFVNVYVVVGELQTDGTYTAPIENLASGEHEVALTAVDADGIESDFSNSVGFRLAAVPQAPVLLAA